MSKSKTPWRFLFLLILAGEAIFILPFVLARVFRPTVLHVFALDNFELGLCFSVYGIVALVSYLVGGPLADKFPPQKLIAVSLWSTAVGGLVYASYPSFSTLKILYAYWGFTTIFLFWAPMIKATRIWGGDASQGKAFGFLDGGRGLVGALFGALGVLVFTWFVPSDNTELTLAETQVAFRQVILVSSAIVASIGVLVWFLMELKHPNDTIQSKHQISFSELRQVLRLPSVWLLMLIVLCAYVGYKITDIFSLYAQDVMHYNQIESAKVGNVLLFLRPIVGVLIGLITERYKTTTWLFSGFVISCLGALLFAFGIVTESTIALFFISTTIVASGVYAVRSLYFAVLEVGKIPLALTGTAVGVISLVGFAPDIFIGPVIGYLLEEWPGQVGHAYVFRMLAGFSFIGAVCAYTYKRIYS